MPLVTKIIDGREVTCNDNCFTAYMKTLVHFQGGRWFGTSYWDAYYEYYRLINL